MLDGNWECSKQKLNDREVVGMNWSSVCVCVCVCLKKRPCLCVQIYNMYSSPWCESERGRERVCVFVCV